MELSSATDWITLCALVLLFGIRHGFDPDHLATVDGLTRYNSRHQPALARYCGSLFSTGHGAVVLIAAMVFSVASSTLQIPPWLEGVGMFTSVFFLLLLGLLNLRAVLRAQPHETVAAAGLKAQWLRRLCRISNPWLIMLVGALFAISLDTLSLAVLFAAAAKRYGGSDHVLMLGLLFLIGMLVVDGLNGLWLSRLLKQSDRFALIGSRMMGLALATISLLLAALIAVRWLLPDAARWTEGREALMGALVLGIVGSTYVAAYWLNRRLSRRLNPRPALIV